MKRITDYLQELGLTEIEALLYQGLLETGPTTIMDLAEHTAIKRITVHFNIKNLIEKGLVAQTVLGSRRQITAEPPERLEYLIEKKEQEVKRIREDFSPVLQSISTLANTTKKGEDLQIKYYEGKSSVMHIYEEALEAKEFRAYVNPQELHEVFSDNMNLFIETHKSRKDMQVWEIMENSAEAQRYIKNMPKERYYYRLIPKGISLSIIDYMMFDGKVAIVNLEKHTTGILISNNHYYESAKAIYEFVWQMLSQ